MSTRLPFALPLPSSVPPKRGAGTPLLVDLSSVPSLPGRRGSLWDQALDGLSRGQSIERSRSAGILGTVTRDVAPKKQKVAFPD